MQSYGEEEVAGPESDGNWRRGGPGEWRSAGENPAQTIGARSANQSAAQGAARGLKLLQ